MTPESTPHAPDARSLAFHAALLFSATMLSGTVTTAILMSTGWRPYRLPLPMEVIWLAGTGLACLGTVLLALAACPVSSPRGESATRRRWLILRLGLALFLVGTAVASVVELFTPVQR